MFGFAKKRGKDGPDAPRPHSPDALCPDSPLPFGYKTGWLCVPGGRPQAVAEALGLADVGACNWARGLERAGREGAVFLSPALDGWVLAVGWVEEDLDRLSALAAKFPRLQYFASHRVADYCAWARWEGGALLRAYAYAGEQGEVLWDEGALTPEEIALGAERFQRRGQELEGTEFPDEGTVLRLAAAWGVDTTFAEKEYPPALGRLGRLGRRTPSS